MSLGKIIDKKNNDLSMKIDKQKVPRTCSNNYGRQWEMGN